MSLGAKIKKLRKTKKMTQKELADIIGVKTITIRKYESDEREPKIEVLEKIASALDTNIWELLDTQNNTNIHVDENDKPTFFIDSHVEDVKSKFDDINSLYEAEIEFISNPIIQKTFNYSYSDLSKYNYDKLLVDAIEAALYKTIKDINKHITNGDLFDGINSWISKDSPLLEIFAKDENYISISKKIGSPLYAAIKSRNNKK